MIKLLFILFIISCASTEQRKPLNSGTFKKYLGAACLTGEGQGRVEIGPDQFLFDYGSQLERNTWMLGVDVPMRGEEDLLIKKKGKGFLFEGSFYRQLAAGYQDLSRKDRSYKRDYLTKFLVFMGQNIFLLKDFTKKKNSWFKSYFEKRCGPAPVEKCTFDYQGRTFEVTNESLKIAKKLESFDLVWFFKGYSSELNGSYEKSELMLKRGRKSLMGVHFFHESCQIETTSL